MSTTLGWAAIPPSKWIEDLEWIWNSDSFLRAEAQEKACLQILPLSFFQRHQASFQNLIDATRVNPCGLEAFLASRPRLYKLGLYAQTLLEFAFHSIPEIELLASDLAIQEIDGSGKSRTVGSLDFLIRDVLTGEVLHIEFAVKLLLRQRFAGRHEEFSDWIGPEGRDRLDLKLKKLSEQQLPLVQRASMRTLLLERFGVDSEQVQSFALLRGLGFVAPGTPRSSKLISDSSLVGEWCSMDGWVRARVEQSRFIPKLAWLGRKVSLDFGTPGCEGLGLYGDARDPDFRTFRVHSEWPTPRQD
jgi:hypothetical protein